MKNLNKNDPHPSYLPKGANIFYIREDNKFMAEAKEMARLSNEQQQPVGAVFVYNGEIIDRAYNKNPISNKFLIKLHQRFCPRHLLGIPTGKYYWMCPGCASKKKHPENQTSTRFLKKGISGGSIDIYTWGH
jgi:deoxycytidylate deaminase